MFGGQSKPINTLFTLQHTPNKIFVTEKSKFLCGLISSPASFARFDSFSRSWLVVEWWSCNLTAACVKRHLCRDHPMTPPTVSDEIATIGVFCKFWDNPTGPQHFFNGILIGSSLRVPDLPGHGRSACVLVAVCIALLLTGLILIEHWKPWLLIIQTQRIP